MPKKLTLADKKARKSTKAYLEGGQGESNYSRKRKYLAKNGGWGFEYAEPKPWKA